MFELSGTLGFHCLLVEELGSQLIGGGGGLLGDHRPAFGPCQLAFRLEQALIKQWRPGSAAPGHAIRGVRVLDVVG